MEKELIALRTALARQGFASPAAIARATGADERSVNQQLHGMEEADRPLLLRLLNLAYPPAAPTTGALLAERAELFAYINLVTDYHAPPPRQPAMAKMQRRPAYKMQDALDWAQSPLTVDDTFADALRYALAAARKPFHLFQEETGITTNLSQFDKALPPTIEPILAIFTQWGVPEPLLHKCELLYHNARAVKMQNFRERHGLSVQEPTVDWMRKPVSGADTFAMGWNHVCQWADKSIAESAKALGVSKPTFNLYRRGVLEVQWDTVHNVLKAWDIPQPMIDKMKILCERAALRQTQPQDARRANGRAAQPAARA